jgi:hypothetical protein
METNSWDESNRLIQNQLMFTIAPHCRFVSQTIRHMFNCFVISPFLILLGSKQTSNVIG